MTATKAILGQLGGMRRDGRAGRTYTWKGQTFSSVTSILSAGVPKPALLPWGIKSVAEGAVRLVQSGELVQAVADDAALATKLLKDIPYADRDDAAGLGTTVHEAAEAYILERPYVVADERVAPYIEQFKRFLAEHTPEYLAAEATVYNRARKYAGTLDAIVTMGGETLVLDYKTGRSGVYPEAALQLAAYRHAEFIGLPDGSEHPLPETHGAVVLWLQPDGYRLVRVDASELTFRYFFAAQSVATWVNVAGKAALQQEV